MSRTPQIIQPEQHDVQTAMRATRRSESEFLHVVQQVLLMREALLDTLAAHATPCYLFDRAGLMRALASFRSVFDKHLSRHLPFYAVKSNHHPLVVCAAVDAGYGLDVSSGREFRQAIECQAPRILFSGPAKSSDDLLLALGHADRTIINLDSFHELQRLGQTAARSQKFIRAGVRIHTSHHGAWCKFGIPLRDLAHFWQFASQYKFIQLQGIQFHLSWNRNAAPYENIIRELGEYLRSSLPMEDRRAIQFVDVGGGYRPHQLEGSYECDPSGQCHGAASAPRVMMKESIALAEYASAIGAAIRAHLAPVITCDYCTEPGRILATHAMHIALRVVDRKSNDLVIVDGGFNMVGWEKYLHTYCPIVNVSRPAMHEIPVRICGSLCDCEDVWGFSCFAEGVEEGDILVVPFQGAYTHCVAQQFIRDIPPVYPIVE
jgi:diaminopimelate decarboxylase